MPFNLKLLTLSEFFLETAWMRGRRSHQFLMRFRSCGAFRQVAPLLAKQHIILMAQTAFKAPWKTNLLAIAKNPTNFQISLRNVIFLLCGLHLGDLG